MTVEIVILIVLGIFALFVFLHLRPLSGIEVESLGLKRREKQIRKYFTYNHHEYHPNADFKKRMKPNGSYYNINTSLIDFPSTSASLLKYKKHEWIILGFEKQKSVDLIWVNKGFDRESVSSHISAETIAQTAKKNSISSVLFFHNHPNINPNKFDCTKPSQQDFVSADHFSQILNGHGINLIEFVCERGKHYEYYLSPADSFMPMVIFINEIENVNGKSKWINLGLHTERILSFA